MYQIGVKFADAFPGPRNSLSDYHYAIGDLVTLSGKGLNSGGIIYKITKDCPPPYDATWGTYKHHVTRYMSGPGRRKAAKHTYEKQWWLNEKHRPINDLHIHGCITLHPVFAFAATKIKSKSVPYRQIEKRIKRVDIIELSLTFAKFQTFIKEELKRLSGE